MYETELEMAFEDHRVIRITYKAMDGRITTRDVEVFVMTDTHIGAFCHLVCDLRTFRRGSIMELQLLGESFSWDPRLYQMVLGQPAWVHMKKSRVALDDQFRKREWYGRAIPETQSGGDTGGEEEGWGDPSDALSG